MMFSESYIKFRLKLLFVIENQVEKFFSLKVGRVLFGVSSLDSLDRIFSIYFQWQGMYYELVQKQVGSCHNPFSTNVLIVSIPDQNL